MPARAATVTLLAAVSPFIQAESLLSERPVAQFQAGVDVVQVGVSVRQGGRYVADLAAADFAVFEDGRRQELSFFARGERPIALTLMIDASSSMHEKIGAAQAAATRLLEALRPNDIAQIVQFGDRTEVLQEFTSDRAALEATTGRVRPSGQTALRNAVYVVLKELRRRLGRERVRRHAIVVLSDGLDSASVVSEDDLLNLARRASIVIHTVGLRPKDIPKIERQAWGRAAHLLAVLARDTGGEAHFPRSLAELEPIYGPVAADLRAQYSLGYVPGPGTRRGEWRRITVVTPGRQNLALRHRTGYYAPSR